MSAIDLAIFDLDGTLVDSAPDIARAVAATLREAGVDPPPLDEVKAMVGDGARVLIGRALAAAGAQRDEERLLGRFLVHYGDALCVDTRLYEGVAETLAALRAQGVRMAVLTNKPGDLARRLLDTLGIGGFFQVVIGDGDGFPRKPDPAAARDLLARTGASVANTVIVGDGLPDVQMAIALGARVVAAGWGYVAPERLRAAGASVVAEAPGRLTSLLSLPSPRVRMGPSAT
jgi:phosphoglycolate phosphatase